MKTKNLFSIMASLTMTGSLFAEGEFKPLFNGKDLTGWENITAKNAKGPSSFRINAGEKAIHTYLGEDAGSKQEIECLHTEQEYSSFILKLEYKWLEKRFAPRVEHDRDAGILFHLHGDLKALWPNCLEMQLGESETSKTKDRYVTGDLWVIGKGVQVENTRDEKGFFSPDADSVSVGRNISYDKSFIPVGNEKPHGEWNEITLTVHGGREAIFELNGKVVNRITDMSYVVDGKRVPLEKGRIGLQCEYAELLYRNIRIQDLEPVKK
ncbi:DUF1080 domain-containing protein [Verrucomicrobiaceae bacterium 227]